MARVGEVGGMNGKLRSFCLGAAVHVIMVNAKLDTFSSLFFFGNIYFHISKENINYLLCFWGFCESPGRVFSVAIVQNWLQHHILLI